MSFQNNLCDLRVLGGEYVTAIRARRTRRNLPFLDEQHAGSIYAAVLHVLECGVGVG